MQEKIKKKHRKSQINSKKRKSTAGKEAKKRGYKGDNWI